MINVNEQMSLILKQLGERLRQARLARNESQELMASRIGISRQSYSKMEQGGGSVTIATWLAASDILGLLKTWEDVLAEKEDLFELYERERQARKRASRKRQA